MPVLFLGFVFVTLLWMLWAIAWVVVWAVALLAWPIALVLGAFALFRAVTRSSLRHAEAPFHRRASPTRDGAFHNSAFQDYRQETLRKVDEEQGKFREFLERLRKAKDKEEFDRFMAERRPRPSLSAV